MPQNMLVKLTSPQSDPTDTQLPGSVLARFLELRGRRIVQAGGVLWYSVPGRFLMSLPYQKMLRPDLAELHSMIRDAGVFGARFPSLAWSGLASGLYVRHRGPYDIGSIHIKHRPRVRHARTCFDFRPAQKSELLNQGRALNLATMTRQGRYDPEFGERSQWNRFVEAVFACPGISVPAVFSGSRLAAYMIVCREQGWLHILHQNSRSEDLSNFPNHLLTYSVTEHAATDQALEAVCYGCVPLFEADGLNEYKLRFGYQLLPHNSVIQLHPFIRNAAGHPVGRAVLRLARRLRRGDQRLETIESVLQGAHSSARG